jgi:rubredoxin
MCSYCYDATLGDPDRGHPAETPFADLPEGWTCPWCGAPKRTFVPEEELFA